MVDLCYITEAISVLVMLCVMFTYVYVYSIFFVMFMHVKFFNSPFFILILSFRSFFWTSRKNRAIALIALNRAIHVYSF